MPTSQPPKPRPATISRIYSSFNVTGRVPEARAPVPDRGVQVAGSPWVAGGLQDLPTVRPGISIP